MLAEVVGCRARNFGSAENLLRRAKRTDIYLKRGLAPEESLVLHPCSCTTSGLESLTDQLHPMHRARLYGMPPARAVLEPTAAGHLLTAMAGMTNARVNEPEALARHSAEGFGVVGHGNDGSGTASYRRLKL
jgi:hypothetical protein